MGSTHNNILNLSKTQDYLKAVSAGDGAVFELKKIKTKTDSNVKINTTITGTPTAPIEIGKAIHTKEGNNTTTVQNIFEDPKKNIFIETSTSIYQIVSITSSEKRRINFKYLKEGYLDFNDTIPDGFIDGGRNMQLVFNEQTNQVTPQAYGIREIITVDRTKDTALSAKIKRAKALVQQIPDELLETKIALLSLFTSNALGGSQQEYQHRETDIEKLSDKEIYELTKQSPHLPLAYIGYLNHGMCRHRAILFKVLADECGIPSRLVRGNYDSAQSGWHIWNVVKIKEKYYVVDTMQKPGELYPEESEKAKKYMRMKEGHIQQGFGGKSIPMH